MGKVVEKKKKKKGRPSLLDLQKRSLRQQQQQQEQQQQKQNPNSNPYSNSNYRKPIVPTPNPNPNGRFTRRNPYPDGISAAASEGAEAGDDDDDDNEEEEEDSNGKRKEKKLKFVLRLPSNQQHRSSLNSSLNSGSYGSDSNAEDENTETLLKKRRVNGVGDGSGPGDAEKGNKTKSVSKGEEESGSRLESGPTTPLPDKKLLVFILDRLQKKDTYGVFSDPVDPNELPDYHEIIEHPMDFGTVRKKLDGGAYANLEQFEKDVFLICSNAMRYNSPDTIYYRQARSMQEVAKKDFENLRQDSEDNEPEPRVVRRGRPPTKHLKKPPGRPYFERAGSEFSSDATLATAGDTAIWPISDRSGLSDVSGRIFHGSRSTEAYTGWLAERKSEKNDEFPGMSVKYGKKQFVLDENRRNTYKQFHPLAVGCKPSVFTAFDGEPKQLMTVGLQAEYSYARSLARFAANLGPVAWKIASQKIERALPAGLNFGPGWVGENDTPQPWPRPQPQVQAPPPARLLPQPSPLPKISMSATISHEVEPEGEKTSEKNSSNSLSDGIHSKLPLPSSATSSAVKIRTPEPTTAEGEAARGSNYDSGFSLLNSSVGAIRPRPPFQIHQSHLIHYTMNGCSGEFGFNLSPQMGKLARPGRLAGSFGSEAAMASGMLGTVARSNNFVHPKPVGHSESDKLSRASNTVNSGDVLLNSCQESQLVPGMGLHPPSWGGLSVHQKIDSVPPDLNVRFHSPGSSSSSVPVESPQPDLALQL
ncbi:uncharacterized protein LOC122662232 isoform X2 [Telopea speciosissima]|uniref:uncharacterized protein LOC122662232 isoform X2 n=1 Tax=Telopea speciosissima TaxID=54955 RepID=UPI001CC53382|nr:uncharacterized protein LOC122662232 isoform X2 [Telopea speciosissima]